MSQCLAMSTGSSQGRTGMEMMKLPCAQPWGVPPPGVLFTPEAYRRYSAFQQVRDVVEPTGQCGAWKLRKCVDVRNAHGSCCAG